MEVERWKWCLGLVVFLLWPFTATATVVVHLGLEEMSQASDVIAHAAVKSVEVIAPSPGVLLTRITFHARDVVRGEGDFHSGDLTVVVIGGRGADREVRIPGMPTFRVGEEVLIFLERTDHGHAFTGLSQGVFRIHFEPMTGAPVASRSIRGLGLVNLDPGGKMRWMHAPSPVVNHPLAHLRSEIRWHLRSLDTEEVSP